jgi:hypothetical protein
MRAVHNCTHDSLPVLNAGGGRRLWWRLNWRKGKAPPTYEFFLPGIPGERPLLAGVEVKAHGTMAGTLWEL